VPRREREKLLRLRLPIIAVMLVFLLTLILVVVAPLVFAGGAVVWTDKEDYAPEETVTIFGSGFLPNAQVTVSVTRPDSHVDTIYAVTDEYDNFTCTYQLDGIEGVYTVTATDGTNTATTTFTDTARYFTATISPTTALTGETKQYTINITNDLSSSSGVVLGSAKITVPSGFTSVSIISVSYPSGKPWNAVLESGYIKLNTTSDSYRLSRGESVLVTFSATAPATAGTYEWTTSAWTDRSYRSGVGKFTIKGPQPKVTVTAPSTVNITVTSSPATGSGFVKVDGTPITTPTMFTWTVGSTHTLEALSPVSGGTDIRYVWTSWSDGGSQTHAYMVPSSSETVTAYYKTQYQVTFAQTGLDDTATGTVVTINGVGKTKADLPLTDWFDSGTTYSYSSVVSSTVADKRFRLDSVTGPASPITSSGTVTSDYVPQYKVTFAQSGLDNTASGTVVTVSGTPKTYGDLPFKIDWLDDGSSLAFEYSDIVASSVSGKRFKLVSVSHTSPLTVTAPTTVTGTYKIQYQITVTASPSQALGGTFKVTYTSCGTTYNSVEKTTSWTEWVDADTTVTVTEPQDIINIASGTRLKFDNYSPSSSVTMDGAKTITLVYKTQYYLTVNTNPAEVLTLNPTAVSGQGWYDSGTTATVDAVQNVDKVAGQSRYDFRSWTDATPTGVGNQATVLMDGPKTATANYQLQYYLTVTSPYGTTGGQGWYDKDATAYATVTPLVVSGPTGVQYVFTHWSGDATGTTSPSDPITMDGPKTAVANWKTQYKLIVRTSGLGTKTTNVYNGTTVLGTASDSTPFEAWYDANSLIQLDIDSPINNDPTKYVFTEWTGDASGSSRPVSVTVNSPKDITAHYSTQCKVTFTQTGLDSSATGTVVTINGNAKTFADLPYTVWVDYGTVITYSYSNEVSSSTTGKRFILTGVDGPSSPITVTSTVTVTGNYKTQFAIAFSQSGVGSDFTGTVLIVDGTGYSVSTLPVSFWWDASSVHNFAFQSPLVVTANAKQYVWTSTTGLSTLQSGSITVSASGSVAGNYKTQYYLNVASPYDSPTPTSGWFDSGTPITASVTSPVSGPTGTRYVCTGWTGTGSVPASGTGTTVSFTINAPSSITWNWKTQYLLTVVTDPSGLSPQPTRNPAGESGPANGWWYDSGTSVTLTAQAVSGYTFDYWDVDGPSKGSGVNPITVVMNEPHKATAHYVTAVPPLSVSISPLSASILVGQSVPFNSTVSGGTQPYKYQWYLNDDPVSGANQSSWTFTPTATGRYYVYLKVTDDKGNTAQSETAVVYVGTIPVGGYTISITKQTSQSTSQITAYAALTLLFAAMLSLTKRKRK
jgi:uncharacterized repeat protein (TIGR02543 family)